MIKNKPGKTTVVRFTIWDNFARHCLELRAAGVPEAELAPLRAAAQAVADAEEAEARLSINLAAATVPFTSCTGWIIPPPTNAARYWARMAMLKVTGGVAPDGVLGEVHALLAGLLVLRLWGESKRDVVMRYCSTTGALAEALAQEAEAATSLDSEQLAGEWLLLMGIRPDKKKARTKYQTLLAAFRRRRRARKTTRR